MKLPALSPDIIGDVACIVEGAFAKHGIELPPPLAALIGAMADCGRSSRPPPPGWLHALADALDAITPERTVVNARRTVIDDTRPTVTSSATSSSSSSSSTTTKKKKKGPA